ncbi:MAG: methionine aminopeptidase type [Patescibacteria group bacterium]|nr:methionine aminopeptidase type [Patescibacteria group bacterium]
MIIIKTPAEIEAMRVAGKRHASILEKLSGLVRPGISTGELDRAAEMMVKEYGDTPAFLGYKPDGADRPFPATLCISVNDEVVHGIPDDNRILNEGDIVSIDLGLWHDGVVTDAAVTVPVGKISKQLEDLLSATEDALEIGIAAAQPGAQTGDVGYAIESFVNKRYGIVREFSGHGVGRMIHEDPYIPNFGKSGTGERLVPGMTIAIEPMLNIGKAGIEMLDDGYTVVTHDGKQSAHFEHTILITETGNEILTKK